MSSGTKFPMNYCWGMFVLLAITLHAIFYKL